MKLITTRQLCNQHGCGADTVIRHARALGVGRQAYEGLRAPLLFTEAEAARISESLENSSGGRPIGAKTRAKTRAKDDG